MIVKRTCLIAIIMTLCVTACNVNQGQSAAPNTAAIGANVSDHITKPRHVEYLVDYQAPAVTETKLSSEMSREAIGEVAKQVADWQLAQFDIRSNKMRPEMRPSGVPNGWMYATLHVGLWRWADQVDDIAYKQAILNLSQLNEFQLGPRVYHADDHAVGDVYLSLYQAYGGDNKISHLKSFFDEIVGNPDNRSFDFEVKERDVHVFELRTFKDPWCTRRWCWADAAFMSPPVFAHLSQATSDSRYIEFMHAEFWAMTDYLFDDEYSLFLRDSRYFTLKDEKGRPIFWGRGNGWVLAGIARIIEYLPIDDPYLKRYQDLFVRMSQALLAYQNEDGSWPSSLLEAGSDAHSETSATALIAFGLGWGVNNGLLEAADFTPAIEKAWSSIVANIHPDGKVGFVQQVAFAPGSAAKDDTQLYGSGAVLLAAAELYRLVDRQR